ncbi:MAG TPA: FAD-dependent oxidoreductase [Candidatus Saccharimonadales bacterium]|nr:FAD-dependent oxidoreductase [Candidatus Saccharimonadales bacterium]
MAHGEVIVVGSGLAGMTAGVYLSEAGYKVYVLEAAAHPGGRTSSWIDQGMPIESGLHRFLGFYTALPEVLAKVGVSLNGMLRWEDEIEIRTPQNVHATLALAPLHKPFKTIWDALGHSNFLSPADKLTLAAMFAAGAKEYVSDPLKLDQITVLAHAKQHKVSEQTIRRALIPLTEGIFFVPIGRYSMYNLMGLFMPYLKSLPKLRVGAFKGGMSEVMIQPMADYITKHGGTIHTNTAVRQLLVTNGAVTGVFTAQGEYRANHVILAASLYGAQQIITSSFHDRQPFRDLLRLPTMPAVTFQIELEKPSMPVDRTTFGPTTALASFAEQSRTTFRQSAGRLSIILSPPKRFITMPPAQILEIVKADAKTLGVPLNGIKQYRKIVLAGDFYSLAIGSEALRPPQKTSIPGLTLAGDYTKQPYLATMEGATVSGKLAAGLLLKK